MDVQLGLGHAFDEGAEVGHDLSLSRQMPRSASR
jgi:hypothetical protein